jgi:hypothetical protein
VRFSFLLSVHGRSLGLIGKSSRGLSAESTVWAVDKTQKGLVFVLFLGPTLCFLRGDAESGSGPLEPQRLELLFFTRIPMQLLPLPGEVNLNSF